MLNGWSFNWEGMTAKERRKPRDALGRNPANCLVLQSAFRYQNLEAQPQLSTLSLPRREDSYEQILLNSSIMPIMLYDTSDRRTWMVTALGIIPHMTHVRAFIHKKDFPALCLPALPYITLNGTSVERHRKPYIRTAIWNSMYQKTMTNQGEQSLFRAASPSAVSISMGRTYPAQGRQVRLNSGFITVGLLYKILDFIRWPRCRQTQKLMYEKSEGAPQSAKYPN